MTFGVARLSDLVDDSWGRKRKTVEQFFIPLPRESMPASPAVQPVFPSLMGEPGVMLQLLVVSPDPVILEVAEQLGPQSPVLLSDGIMAHFATPAPQGLGGTTQTLPGRPPLDHPRSALGLPPPRPSPVMREPQKIVSVHSPPGPEGRN